MDSEGSGEDGCFRMMMINSPSSGMVANSTSDKVSASESMNHFYGSSTSWDLLGNFVDSSSAMASPINPHLLQNQAMAPQPPHILPSHSGQPDMLPGSFYGQSGRSWAGTQIPTTEDHCHNSSQVRRKRKQSIGEHKELSKEEDDKKPESTQATKAKDCPEPSKENYIHVRAKRGQATNSHSLAERVRRERISERMRLLQELVPGCNKITGKAMMLDEIINYVQSLQQQVEFLSMKLATVNPELNLDIDRILSKEILHSTAPVITSGLHAFLGYHSDSAPPLLPPPQLWSNELQGILHTGFDADPSACSLGSNGLSKKAP